MGRRARTNVSAVNAVVRSSDLSRGHTYHQASKPNTRNEKKLWIPKIVKASMAAAYATPFFGRKSGLPILASDGAA
jgi:hypothetical protein